MEAGMDLDKYTERPLRALKALCYGQPKRGKTHAMCTLAIQAYKHLGLTGHIACIDTGEGWVADWYDSLHDSTGAKPVVAPAAVNTPDMVEKFIAACEDDGRIAMILIDSATDLLDNPRKAYQANNPECKQLPYAMLDAPYHRMVDRLGKTRIPWIATAREKDDKAEVDGREIVVGKISKSSDLEYKARLLVHAESVKGKDGLSAVRLQVRDTKDNAPPPQKFGPNPGPEWCEPYLALYTNEAKAA